MSWKGKGNWRSAGYGDIVKDVALDLSEHRMAPTEHLLAFFPNLGWQELLIIAFIALLIFGRRLPEVGRSLGKGIVEFKKGLQDTGEEIKRANSTPTNSGGGSSNTSSEKKSDTPTGE